MWGLSINPPIPAFWGQNPAKGARRQGRLRRNYDGPGLPSWLFLGPKGVSAIKKVLGVALGMTGIGLGWVALRGAASFAAGLATAFQGRIQELSVPTGQAVTPQPLPKRLAQARALQESADFPMVIDIRDPAGAPSSN